MKVVRFKDIEFIPSNHEDPKNPGVYLKRMLLKKDLLPGRIQMINWAKSPPGRSFQAHFHEKMTEVFIILNGRITVVVGKKKVEAETGDLIIAEAKEVHQFINNSSEDVNYIAIGVIIGEGGKTVLVK